MTVEDIGGNRGPVFPLVWPRLGLYIRFRFAAIACSLVGVESGPLAARTSKSSRGASNSSTP